VRECEHGRCRVATAKVAALTSQKSLHSFALVLCIWLSFNSTYHPKSTGYYWCLTPYASAWLGLTPLTETKGMPTSRTFLRKPCNAA
jgi:hypothetical protein